MLGLSISSLSVFKNCPRCFWLEKNNKIKRPRGIFPSLPKGMDRVMKEYVENIIAQDGAVPWLNSIPGTAPFSDRARLQKFRSWRTFQREVAVNGQPVTAWGELDDLIENLETGIVSPWDYKTKGDEPDEEYGRKYYQTQLDMYHLLLEGNGLKCSGTGYLTYGWPTLNELNTLVFKWKNLVLDTDPMRAVAMLSEAATCLWGPEPPTAIGCEYCSFATQRQIENNTPFEKKVVKAQKQIRSLST